MCFIAFLSEEPQGDSQDRTDSVGKAVGANAVSVEAPPISLREISYAIKKAENLFIGSEEENHEKKQTG